LKRRTFVLGLLIAVLLTMPVSAQTERTYSKLAQLSFQETTAVCFVTISGAGSKYISADISLWNGSTCVKTWERNNTGSIYLKEEVSVSKGKDYTLIVDYTIGGESQEPLTSAGTCK